MAFKLPFNKGKKEKPKALKQLSTCVDCGRTLATGTICERCVAIRNGLHPVTDPRDLGIW